MQNPIADLTVQVLATLKCLTSVNDLPDDVVTGVGVTGRGLVQAIDVEAGLEHGDDAHYQRVEADVPRPPLQVRIKGMLYDRTFPPIGHAHITQRLALSGGASTRAKRLDR